MGFKTSKALQSSNIGGPKEKEQTLPVHFEIQENTKQKPVAYFRAKILTIRYVSTKSIHAINFRNLY